MRGLAARALLAGPLLTLAILPARALGAPALAFTQCRRISGFSCATMPVPLERSGPALGSLRLHIARRLAGSSPSRDAVIALAGGPGQSALPLAGYLTSAIAPALHGRDLIVFDQRGTGQSGPLRCSALHEALSGPDALGALVRRCGEQIGAARSAYSTRESVEDIEAIRQAAGYEKLVLYGTSYGTKVALQYAESHPSRVEAMVLDSVVPAQGNEPFAVDTFGAIRRVIAEICSHEACRQIAAHPVAEIAQLGTNLGRHRLHGFVYDGSGRRRPAALGEQGLLSILLAGDLNPALRAMLPAAVHAALHRDAAPLLRLDLLSRGLVPSLPKRVRRQSPEAVDTALFLDTSCEDTPFPWSRASSPSQRLAEARSALAAIPRQAFYPFDRSVAFRYGLTTACAHWPYEPASAAPTGAAPLPDVPTLILSGAQDLRTPTANARAIAAKIPDSKLLVVPYTGHSVLGSDLSGCAHAALGAFFSGREVLPCGPAFNLFSPTPAIPKRLSQVRRVAGVTGRAGRTLAAVLASMLDLDRQVIGATLQADQVLPSGSSFGGLRGGYARLTATALRLSRFSFVRGVQLSGTFPVHAGRLGAATVQISGRAAAHGEVRIGSGSRVSGALGGVHFRIDLRTAEAAGAERSPGRFSWMAAHLLPQRALLPQRRALPRGLRAIAP